jgi:RNA polymerase sigma-B factor
MNRRRSQPAASGSLEDVEHALFVRVRDGGAPEARDRLVERYLPLARHVALMLQTPSEPFDDIFQVACVGLIKAIDRFDADRGVAFSTYATPTISGEIKRYFRDRTWSVHISRDLQERVLRLETARRSLTAELGREPTVDDLAAALDSSVERVVEAIRAGRSHHSVSLEAPRGLDEAGDGVTLADTVGAPDERYRRAEERALLERLMAELPRRDRSVLLLRFGLDLTQEQIGARMGLSQMHVSRVLRSSLGRLREVVDEHGV